MRFVRNDKGIALVTSLMFTLISLGIIMLLLYSVTQGVRISAASKTYKTALDANYGAMELLSKDIFPTLLSGNVLKSDVIDNFAGLTMAFPSGSCFDQKMASSTPHWTLCGADNTSFSIKTAPDVTFNLKATTDPTGYTVYAKIVDTRCGGDATLGQPCSNSDASGIDYLDAGGGVTSSSGTVTPQHRPAYYRIELQAERAANPKEKAQLSVLYAY